MVTSPSDLLELAIRIKADVSRVFEELISPEHYLHFRPEIVRMRPSVKRLEEGGLYQMVLAEESFGSKSLLMRVHQLRSPHSLEIEFHWPRFAMQMEFTLQSSDVHTELHLMCSVSLNPAMPDAVREDMLRSIEELHLHWLEALRVHLEHDGPA